MFDLLSLFGNRNEMGWKEKLSHLNWGLVLLVWSIAAIGILLLFSAGGGSWDPWAKKHALRFFFGLGVMLVVALIDLRFWLRIAYPLYIATMVLLVIVEIMGHIGMGAQRWIAIGGFVVQPSELMKIALTLALARYFHAVPVEHLRRPLYLIPPLVLILMPVGMVLLQPNLGTAMLLILGGAMLFFSAGVPWWFFIGGASLAVAAIPVVWSFMHGYQKERVMTFLNPEADPLDAGYNIIQSKIAFGSGGVFGKGFLHGSQSQLAFLPEKHTDFIFVVLAEEFGLFGGLILLALYTGVIAYGFHIALTSRNQFGRLVALGVSCTLFLYVLVNISMITGLIPVVGIPLPLVSYGGTATLTMLIGVGLLLCVAVHREVRLSKSGLSEW